jgi:hypothetical protein
MAIAETDLIWRLSGGAANEDPAAALGGVSGYRHRNARSHGCVSHIVSVLGNR